MIPLLNQGRFDAALALIEKALREAAAESPERLTDAARAVVAWKGIFANSRDAAASEHYFRAVFALLEELAGPASPAAMAAADSLAGLLGSLDQFEEAIGLRERVFSHVRDRFAKDDARFLNVREGLAFLYRQAGKEDAAAELYRDVDLCEHLKPALEYLREHGAKLVYCGQPWSDHCHIWVFFDRVLDCEDLIAALRLDECIRIHDHRGTHDGSERGLVCSVHHDGVMGLHPLEA
jgi:tetratricopeptide (TPR) repeat protein